MTIVDVIDTASEQRTFTPLEENERMWLCLLAMRRGTSASKRRQP